MAQKHIKTQAELESPAKVYQLDALDEKVERVLVAVDVITQQTSGVVTQAELKDLKKELIKYVDEEVADSETRTTEKFSPMQKALNKFVWLVVGAVVSVFINAATIIAILRGGS